MQELQAVLSEFITILLQYKINIAKYAVDSCCQQFAD